MNIIQPIHRTLTAHTTSTSTSQIQLLAPFRHNLLPAANETPILHTPSCKSATNSTILRLAYVLYTATARALKLHLAHNNNCPSYLAHRLHQLDDFRIQSCCCCCIDLTSPIDLSGPNFFLSKITSTNDSMNCKSTPDHTHSICVLSFPVSPFIHRLQYKFRLPISPNLDLNICIQSPPV